MKHDRDVLFQRIENCLVQAKTEKSKRILFKLPLQINEYLVETIAEDIRLSMDLFSD